MRGTLGPFAFSFLVSSVAYAQLAPADPNQPPPPPVEPVTEPPPPPPPQPAPAPAPVAPAPAYPPGAPPPAPAYPPPPGYYYPPQPQPPPPAWTPPPAGPDKSARRHDSFYLRLGLGIALGHVTTETDDAPAFKATFDGLGPAYEIMLGGTVGSGIVIGGGIVAQDISDPDVELEPDVSLAEDIDSDNDALGILVLGPFIDWFFDERGGFHAGAMIGIGSIGLRDDDDQASSGLGGSIFAGYDFWVADQWSMGLEGRALFVSSERSFSDTQYQDRARGFQLLFTALYH